MSSIIGGDNSAKRAAEKSRQLQQIANDRQLAALQADDARETVTRKAPRGRKLFSDDTSKSTLA
ncbi:hypothetical protein M1D80_11845 [Phyllobacteriaceae bacterium JZ32]